MAVDIENSPQPVGYWQLVKQNPAFRNIWLGEVISFFGDWFNLIASASLIATLTGSGLAVGSLFVIRMLAPFLVSPLAGVAADRFNRKKLLITADILRAAVVLGFLMVHSPQNVWLLYTLTALQLSISGFFNPARDAILPDITQPAETGTANALSAATWSVMLAVGAALGGVVTGQFGIYPAFIVDSSSFVLSALLISNIHYKPPQDLIMAESDSTSGKLLQNYLDGLRYLYQNRDTFMVALQKAAVALTMGGAYSVVEVAITQKLFVIGHGGATGLGLIYATAGLGTGAGPILLRRLTGDRPRSLRIGLAFAYGLTFVGLLIVAPLSSFVWVIIGTLVHSSGGGINWVFSTQLLFGLAPNRLRGRVFSSEFALFTLASALGSTAGGWALDRAGPNIPIVLFGMAALTLVPALTWAWWTARRI